MKRTLFPRPARIYILPTRIGLFFFALVFTLTTITSTYGHSLGITASLFLLTYLMVAAVWSHQQLKGIRPAQLRLPAGPAFATEELHFMVGLPRAHRGFELAFCTHERLRPQVIAIGKLSPTNHATLCPLQRGHFALAWLRLQTTAPFELFRVWSYHPLPAWLLVAPAPHPMVHLVAHAVSSPPQEAHHHPPHTPADDLSYFGPRPFQSGDSPQRILWPRSLTQQQLWVRTEHVEPWRPVAMINFEWIRQNHPLEEALSLTAGLVRQLNSQATPVVLSTGDQHLEDPESIWNYLAQYKEAQ